MEKEKKINNLSIVAFVLSFLIFPVGLILSIIAMVKGKNYKRENGKRPSYYPFSIAGLIISILGFLITLFTIGIIVFVFGILSYNEKYVDGHYICYYPNSYKPAVSADFSNRKFKWSKYGDEINNSIEGTYVLNSASINNGDYTYKLRIKPINIKSTSLIRSKKRYDIVIKKINNKITISFDNGIEYNCTKRTYNNEF